MNTKICIHLVWIEVVRDKMRDVINGSGEKFYEGELERDGC